MDTTSLYYFIELSKDLHMTRTAERLFVSQQTLSNHIIRLEKQLGCQLFTRKPSLSLTFAGEQVLAFAKRTIRDQANLQDILADVENQKRGSLRFGASTLRLNACLPVILPRFSTEYPYVELQITDQTSRRLEPMIMKGELDFALVAGDGSMSDPAGGSLHTGNSRNSHSHTGSRGKESPLIEELLMRDPIYLCVRDDILQRCFGDKAGQIVRKSCSGADLQDFEAVPFLLFQNRLGNLIRHCFDEAGYNPRSYLAAPYTQIITKIGLGGTAAFFSTDVGLRSYAGGREALPEHLHVFPLLYRGRPLHQEIYLLRSRDRFVSRYAARFLELLRNCFQDIEHHPMEDGPQNPD